MKAARAGWALLLLFGVAQSCTHDFDQFDASGVAAGGSSGSTGGKTSSAGTTTRAGSTNLGGSIGVGGTTGTHAGTTSAGGTTPVNGGAPAEAGAPAAGAPAEAGAAGGGPEPIPCGGPCTLDHATSECVADACAVSTCDDAWGDCNATPDDGCETSVSSDAARCGSCGNKCPSGFVCIDGQCSCDFKNDCGNGSGIECSDHLCHCSLVACRPGERCRDNGGSKACSCNGAAGPGCAENESCCEDTGCTDVMTNPASCGACGRACTSGFVCAAGGCQCDSAEDCGGTTPPENGTGGAGTDGGAPNTAGAPASNIACVAGSCVCDGHTCGEGQRCLANGSCG